MTNTSTIYTSPINQIESLNNQNIGTLLEPENPFSLNGSDAIKTFFKIQIEPQPPTQLENLGNSTRSIETITPLNRNLNSPETSSDLIKLSLVITILVASTAILIFPAYSTALAITLICPSLIYLTGKLLSDTTAETYDTPPPIVDQTPLVIPPIPPVPPPPPQVRSIINYPLDQHQRIHTLAMNHFDTSSIVNGTNAIQAAPYLYYLQKKRLEEGKNLQYLNLAHHNRVEILDSSDHPVGNVFFKFCDEVDYIYSDNRLHSLVIQADFTNRRIYYYDSNGYSIEHSNIAVDLAEDLYQHYFSDLPKIEVFTQNVIPHQLDESTCVDHSLHYITKISDGMTPEEYFRTFSLVSRGNTSFESIRREIGTFIRDGIRSEYSNDSL